MRLVIGGAYQGKLDYAKERYGIEDGWLDGRSCGFTEIMDCQAIHHFHEYIRRLLEGGTAKGEFPFLTQSRDLAALEEWADEFALWLVRTNPDLVIVTNELGYGIVPVEKEDRLWREAVGRVCTRLAAEAEEVVRVVCGIGMCLKGKEIREESPDGDSERMNQRR